MRQFRRRTHEKKGNWMLPHPPPPTLWCLAQKNQNNWATVPIANQCFYLSVKQPGEPQFYLVSDNVKRSPGVQRFDLSPEPHLLRIGSWITYYSFVTFFSTLTFGFVPYMSLFIFKESFLQLLFILRTFICLSSWFSLINLPILQCLFSTMDFHMLHFCCLARLLYRD